MRTQLQAEVEQRIGRNLLRYQLVELRLKHALPLRRLTLSQEGLAALGREMNAQRRQPLGKLLPGYADVFEIEPPEAKQQFLERLEAFLEARNRLVHHLLDDSGFLMSIEACEACIARLDAEYRLAEDIARQVLDLHAFVLNSLKSFLDGWCLAEPGVAGMRALAARQAGWLAQEYGPTAQLHLEVPFEEVLAEAMEVLATERRREDGWTVFSHVPDAIRRDFADPLRGILSVARQLDGYEFAERAVRPDGGKTWMYRRRSDLQTAGAIQ